ncbi:MAG: Histidine kinase protein [Acidobacteriota bacterium]|nr:Histidine kinase protein [Acidobacteriota bacterium]
MSKGKPLKEKEFLLDMELSLRRIKDIQKLFHRFIYTIKSRYDADAACFLFKESGGGELNRWIFKGDAALFDTQFIKGFALKQKILLPNNLLLSLIKVHERLVGIVGLRRSGRDFQVGSGRKLRACCTVMAKELTIRVEEREDRILDRLKEKVVGELRPIDLAYQILDGLRHLVHYDHSSALLTYEKSDGALGVLAEKVAWTKSKSAFIGHKIILPDHVAADLLRRPEIRLLGKKGTNSPNHNVEDTLFRLLDYSRGDRIPSPTSVLCAPLIYRDDLLGILKLASRKRPPFDERDAHIVERFLHIAATSLRNARFADTLGERALQGEMHGALVKAMSHDIRNAIGTILLLGPQIQHDLENEQIDIVTLKEDMNAIIKDAQLIQRIFTNLLREAGPGRSGLGPVDANVVVKEVVELLKTRLDHRHILLKLNFAENLPAVRASRRHLEHIIVNLVTNAADAAPQGKGLITISTEFCPDTNHLRLSVQDNGPGMTPELLRQAQEPFFSTKPGGTGLGLPLCRALAWQINALFHIDSSPGEGAVVTLQLEVET